VTFTPLSPATPVVLQAPGNPLFRDACVIEFTVDVLKTPATDVDPATPGQQTNSNIFATAHANPPAPAGSTAVASASRAVLVKANPTVTTQATPQSVAPGDPFVDNATVNNGNAPTGTVTFNLYGPNDATCAGAPVLTSTKPLDPGTFMATSDPYITSVGGTYRWVATYSGDAGNASAVSPCNDAAEAVDVVAPSITVKKTANPGSLPVPGGNFTFTVVVTNTSPESLTITSLNDNVYGDITKRAGSNCTNAVGTVLVAKGGQYSCAFTGSFTGIAGAQQTDTVMATVTDAAGRQATALDRATVRIRGLNEPTVATVVTGPPTPTTPTTPTRVIPTPSTLKPLTPPAPTSGVPSPTAGATTRPVTAPGGTIPRTGSESESLALLGAALAFLGLGSVAFTKVRRPTLRS